MLSTILGAVIILLIFGGEGVAQGTSASNYPTETIKIIVAFPAGGATDAIARIIGRNLSEKWGQPVIVENRPGAAGSTGSGIAANAAPDGYTLLSTPAGPIVINQFVQKTMPYNSAALVPIAMIGIMPSALSVRPDFPYNTVQELIAFAKAHPGKLNYASQGPGSTSHLSAVMFQEMAGIEILHIPYRGSNPALQDLAAKSVDLSFLDLASSLPLHQAGKIKILAVASAERNPSLPEVPTLQESGLADFEANTWIALIAPAKTPDPIVSKLAHAVGDIIAKPDVKNTLSAMGFTLSDLKQQKLANYIMVERSRWQHAVTAAGLQPE